MKKQLRVRTQIRAGDKILQARRRQCCDKCKTLPERKVELCRTGCDLFSN